MEHSALLRCRYPIPPLRAQGSPWNRKQKERKSQKGHGTPKGQGALNQHEQRLYDLIETEAEWPHMPVPVLCVYITGSSLMFVWDSGVCK